MNAPSPREVLEDFGRILVRRLAQQDETTHAGAKALFEVAAGGRTEWTTEEWQAVLDELDSSELTVGQWLEAKK